MPRPVLFSGTYVALARELASRLADARRGRDLSSLLTEPVSVIVPSRAAADTIVGELLAHTPGGVAGVRLRTLETFALELLNTDGRYPRVAGDRERRVALEAAMETSNDQRFLRPSSAVMLERSYRDLRDSGVTVAQFRNAARGFRDRDLSKSAADVWSAYEANVAAAGAVDPATIFDDATALAATANIAPQIAFGFYDMTGVQRRLVDRLLQRGVLEAIYFPATITEGRPSEACRFATRLFDHFADASETVVTLPDLPAAQIAIRETPTRRDELHLICSDIRRLVDAGTDPRTIGIVARSIDPQETPVLQRIASSYGLHISARTSTRLLAHRLGRILATLLTTAGRGFPRPDVLELMSSRACRGLFGEVELFTVEYATRRHEIAGGPPDVLRGMLARVDREEDIEAINAYIDAVERLSRLTARYPQMTSPREWADEIAHIAMMFEAEDERDLAALDAVDEIVRLLTNAAGMRRTMTAEDVVRLFEQSAIPDEMEETALPEIWLGDVMSFRGRFFEHLFAFAIEQDVFPQTRSEDPLFTNKMRGKVFVREIDDGRDEERLLFQLLLDGAREIAFSFAGSSIDARPRRPSQLLKELAIDRNLSQRGAILKDFVAWVRTHETPPGLLPSHDDARASQILSGDFSGVTPELASRLRLVARRGDDSEYDGFLAVTPLLAAKIEEKLSAIAATDFERYGDCPQRFLLHTIFGFKDIDEPEPEIAIEVRKKGSLYHRVLEAFYSSLQEAELETFAEADPLTLTPELASRLSAIVDREFVEHERLYPSPNATIRGMERRIAHRTIDSFVAADLRFIIGSRLRPKWFEYRFDSSSRHGEPHHDVVTLQLRSGSIGIRGSIDRLDTNELRDSFRIVDYKSGTAGHLENLADDILIGRHLQLALYALAVSKIFGAAPEKVAAFARSISKPSDSDRKFTFCLGDVHDSLVETISTYVDAIRRGKFPAVPLDKKTCDFCIAGLWCSARHDEDSRRAAVEMKSVVKRLAPMESES